MKKGAKVRCIADKYRHGREIPEGYKVEIPMAYIEYTVRKYVRTPFGDIIYLEEIVNPVFEQDGQMVEPGFGTNRFELV